MVRATVAAVAAMLAGVLLQGLSSGQPEPRLAVLEEEERVEPASLAPLYQPITARRGALRSALREASSAVTAGPVFAGPWREAAKGPLPFPGYGEVAGRISAFAEDPTDPSGDTVLMSDAHGGVFLSTDRGATWSDVSGDLPTLVVGSAAIGADGTWFACTGDSISHGTAFTGLGIYRSRDRGRTWQHVRRNIPDETRCARLLMDPLDPALGWVATSAGLYGTRDGGDAWSKIALPLPADATGPFDEDVSDLVLRARRSASDPVHLLAAVGWRGGGTGAVPGRTGRGNGLYLSTDGRTFRRLDPPGFPAPSVQGRVAMASTVGDEQSPDVVWAVVSNRHLYERASFTAPAANVDNPATFHGIWTGTLEGVYSSSDFGRTWTLRADGPSLTLSSGGESTMPGVQAHFNQVLALDPVGADAAGAPVRVVLGLENLYLAESPSGGAPVPPLASWRMLDTCGIVNSCPEVVPHIDQHALHFLRRGKPQLLVGGDGGVYRQPSDGRLSVDGWTASNARLRTLISFGAAMTDGAVVYQALQDNGTVAIDEPGDLWLGVGGDGTKVLLDPRDPEVAYGAIQYGWFFKTTDGFNSYTFISPGVDYPLFHMPMAIDPVLPDRLMIGGQDLELSEAGPETTAGSWTTVFDLGTPEDPSVHPEGNHNVASALAMHDGAAYAGWCGVCDPATFGGSFSSGIATDVGGSWHHAAARGLPERMITSIAVDPADTRRIWVTLGGYSARWTPARQIGGEAAGRGHLFLSEDAGESFRDVSANLPDAPAYKVVLRGREVFVAMRVGAFVSEIAERRFRPIAPSLPRAPVTDIQLTPDGTRMVAATAGRGAWWVDLRTRAIGLASPNAKPKQRKVSCSRKAIAKIKGKKAKKKRKALCRKRAKRRKRP